MVFPNDCLITYQVARVFFNAGFWHNRLTTIKMNLTTTINLCLGIEVNPLYDGGRRKSSLTRFIRQAECRHLST